MLFLKVSWLLASAYCNSEDAEKLFLFLCPSSFTISVRLSKQRVLTAGWMSQLSCYEIYRESHKHVRDCRCAASFQDFAIDRRGSAYREHVSIKV